MRCFSLCVGWTKSRFCTRHKQKLFIIYHLNVRNTTTANTEIGFFRSGDFKYRGNRIWMKGLFYFLLVFLLVSFCRFYFNQENLIAYWGLSTWLESCVHWVCMFLHRLPTRHTNKHMLKTLRILSDQIMYWITYFYLFSNLLWNEKMLKI